MVRLVDDQPVRASGPCPQFLNAQQKFRKKLWTLADRDPEQVDDDVFIGHSQCLEHRPGTRSFFSGAKIQGAGQILIITFWINQAELILPLGKLIEESCHDRGLATGRRAGYKNAASNGGRNK